MRRLLAMAAMLSVLGIPGVARAGVKVTVFDLEAGAGAAKVAAKVTRALRRQVSNQSRFEIVAGKSLAEIKLVFGCVERPMRAFHRCLAKVGRSLKARKIIIGKVRHQGGAYKVVLTVIDVHRPLRPRTVSERIPDSQTTATGVKMAVGQLFGRLFPSAAPGAISLLCNVDGVSVTLNGQPSGECSMVGRKLPARAGTYKLVFSKEGYESSTRVVTVSGGQTSSLNITLEKTGGGGQPGTGPGEGPGTGPGEGSGTTPGTTPSKSDPTMKWKILFYSTISAGAALLVASIFTGLKVKSLESDKEDVIRRSWDGPQDTWITDQDNACTHNKGNQELVDICNKGTKMATVTNALIGVGAVLVAGSGYFLYKAYFAKDKKERATALSAPQPTWVVAPSVTEKGGGVTATFRF